MLHEARLKPVFGEGALAEGAREVAALVAIGSGSISQASRNLVSMKRIAPLQDARQS